MDWLHNVTMEVLNPICNSMSGWRWRWMGVGVGVGWGGGVGGIQIGGWDSNPDRNADITYKTLSNVATISFENCLFRYRCLFLAYRFSIVQGVKLAKIAKWNHSFSAKSEDRMSPFAHEFD